MDFLNYKISSWLSDLEILNIENDGAPKWTQGTADRLANNLIVRMRGFSHPELDVVRARDSDFRNALKLCLRQNATSELARLFRNYRFDPSKCEHLRSVEQEMFGAKNGDRFKWMTTYDVVRQRRELVEGFVLPFVRAQGPELALFGQLKLLEIRCLIEARPIDATTAHHIVIANKANSHPPLALDVGCLDEKMGIRIEFPQPEFQALLHLARTVPDFVHQVAERCAPSKFLTVCAEYFGTIDTYLAITHLSYPMGGGESYIYQTCRVLSEFGMRCIWLSFHDAERGDHPSDRSIETPYYTDVRSSGGLSKENVTAAIDRFQPDLMHTHGICNETVIALAKQYQIAMLAGQHFWDGLVELGPCRNRRILEHISEHRIATNSLQAITPGLITRYVASEFMDEVYRKVGGTEELMVLHPLSEPSQFMVEETREPRYVLCLNVHPHKGGGLFLECLRALGRKIDFMGVLTEPGEQEFVAELRSEFAHYPESKLCGYGNVREFYRTARLVLVPTLVDETFCRVAYEAAMNGIPVLSTSNGYLPYLLGPSGIFLSEKPSEWVEMIARIYNDSDRLAEIGKAQKEFVRSRFGRSADTFAETALALINGSPKRNIGIFTVWGDQGLGNLMHHHARLLRELGYQVHIFSFRAYASVGESLIHQSDPSEWSVPEHADSVHYSVNYREEVPASELREFIAIHKIKILIVPEICWGVNWQRLFDLQIPSLAIHGMPMVEIVLAEEAILHNRLSVTLFNTRSAESNLSRNHVTNGQYIGYGFGTPISRCRVLAKRQALQSRSCIRFLHVAGHNPTVRKNTPRVLEAFIAASRQRSDIELTLTCMRDVRSFYDGEIPDCVKIITGNLPRKDIAAFYDTHDVSIQVSSHEGLGLGFYESIASLTPVLSIDAPPHNEPVRHGVTGWLIPASPVPLPDNSAGIVTAWAFDVEALTRAIVALDKTEIQRVFEALALDHRNRLDDFALQRRLLSAIADKQPTSMIENVS